LVSIIRLDIAVILTLVKAPFYPGMHNPSVLYDCDDCGDVIELPTKFYLDDIERRSFCDVERLYNKYVAHTGSPFYKYIINLVQRVRARAISGELRVTSWVTKLFLEFWLWL